MNTLALTKFFASKTRGFFRDRRLLVAENGGRRILKRRILNVLSYSIFFFWSYARLFIAV